MSSRPSPRSACLLIAPALLLACGAEPPDSDAETFGVREGWPAEVMARTLGDGVINQVPRLRTGEDGEVYVLRREEPSYGNLDAREVVSFITQHAPDGRVLATFDGAGDLLLDFVVHPGGELTTLALRGRRDDDNFNVVLARRRGDGTTVFEHYLADEVSEHDRQAYTGLDATLETTTLPPWLEDGRTLIRRSLRFYFQPDYRLFVLDGGLYMTAPIFGLRIYRLSDSLVPVWAQTILPVSDHWIFPAEPAVALDRDGTLWVTSGTDPGMARVQDAHFGTTLAPRPVGGAVLLSRLDAATGAPRGMTIVDGPWLDDATGLRVDDGIATVVGRSRVRKYDRPNDTTEWDVFLARASADAMLDYRAIDVAREDLTYGALFLDDGRIAVVGTLDFLQVDTNSVVEDGSGMVVLLDRDGAPLHTSILRGPRHVEVTACAASGDALYVGGRLDSYITHTCDADRSGALCHNRAFVARLPLD